MRLFFASLLRPFRWRNPKATARMLMAFARAERSSYFDMMEAANTTSELSRRAQYLRHLREAFDGDPAQSSTSINPSLITTAPSWLVVS